MEGKTFREPISGITGRVDSVVVVPGLPDLARIKDHWFDARALVRSI